MAEPASLPPRATYRLQLNRNFTFADAGRQAGYLAALGVSHVYLSPILAARPGSPHGYDVVDHDRLAPDLGTDTEFRAMVAAFRRHGLGIIVDLVPNHMGIGADNARWMDVLRWGPAAGNAGFFDIDWAPPQPHLAGKVLLPVLDRALTAVLAAREIRLGFDGDGFVAHWKGHAWPITPTSLPETARTEGAAVAAAFNEAPPDRLRRLVDRQCWLPAEWQRASSEINYRRFFAINDLAAIRVEDPAVFEASHRLILALLGERAIDGLRIDHIDGLADPRGYLEQLDLAIRALGREPYILVEKILGEGEVLPESWPVAGTTGYDRLGGIDRLFCDEAGTDALVELYRRATGRDKPNDLVRTAKQRFLETEYASEVSRLARAGRRLAEADLVLRSRPLKAFEAAFRAIITGLPVYRCYVDRHGATAEDRWWLDAAFDAAALDDRELAGFLRSVLTAEPEAQSAFGTEAVLALATLFQQISGPAMAKGLEDTVFYQYVPLLALNEVGGAVDAGPLRVEAFHALNQAKRRMRPDELIAGSTHDTKRGEDARARLLCLTSAAALWEAALSRWPAQPRQNAAIGANERLYLFQTMLGAWPPGLRPEDADGLAGFAARLRPAMLKAVREAKERTSWTRPDQKYESALDAFIEKLLDPGRSAPFLVDFAAIAERIGFWGALTSLSATVLRLTVPGVPDIYQGSEGWNLALVDPDNRRAVDFATAATRLRTPLRPLAELPSGWRDGAAKTALIREVLALRRQKPMLFARGDYQPLRPSGPRADCLVAFARSGEQGGLAVLAPRLWPRLWPDGADAPQWGETRLVLPPGRYRNLLTGAPVADEDSVGALLGDQPCAVLTSVVS